jgi:phage terminase large subunit
MNAEASAILEKSKGDPAWFLMEVLGVPYLTSQQRDVIASVAKHRRTCVTAGNGVGKTWLAARLALWFLYTNPQSKVVTTAPTWFQVENLLWRELRVAHQTARFPLGGTANQTQLSLSEEWFAIGLSTNDPTRFQGTHAPRVMVIFDEATGVSAGIWDAAEGLAVGPHDRFLAIGNPTDPLSEFKRKDDSGSWNVIRLNCEEHPNVKEDRIVVPGAVTKDWVDERLKEYGGRETGLYRARVRGLWPEEGTNTLIPLRIVEAAQAKWKDPDLAVPCPPPVAIGCDVARFGQDETVIFTIDAEGNVSRPITRFGQDLMATAGQLATFKAQSIGVDDSGLGGGVTDRLRELGMPVVPCVAGSGAREEKKFVNARAEMWWALREALAAGDISLPADHKLSADLTNVEFSYDSRGRVKLESKADIKKRIGRSPDRGDALAIANWVRTPRIQYSQGKILR